MRFRLPHRPPPVEVVEDKPAALDNEKEPQVQADDASDLDESATLQLGVQRAEAITKVWTKNQLIAAFVIMWMLQFIQAFSSGVTGTLTPYVTSSFYAHSLTATTSILSSLIAGLFKLPYAKIIDVWGRPQGLALMVFSCVIGLIMMAGCQNVQTYCAAQVFYYLGYNGVDFTMTIFIADCTKLRNRAFWLAYSASPWMVVVWCYGPAASSVLDTIGFKWGFGVFAIAYPVVASPLIAIMYLNMKKAERMGLIVKAESNRTFMQSVVYYAKEFDIIGLLALAVGLGMFLLSFSLYSYQPLQWRSPLILCLLIFGILLVLCFVVWERFFAPVTFVPWPLLKDRTVIFTFTMVGALYCGWYMWDSYFYSFLIVVQDLSVTQATYVTTIYTMGSCFWCFIMGFAVRYNGRIKWHSLCFGAPLTILGVGLLIKFRDANSPLGYLIMCQIFIAFGGGTLVICEQMTVMAVSKHKNIPAILAVEAMVWSIGSSVGSTIAAAMWTGIFPKKLAENLPTSAQANLTDIYGSLTVQTSYPIGSETRDAINKSYGETQRLMVIGALCVYCTTLVSIALWRDINVKKIKQRVGVLF